jgi:hypothetical protein
MWTAVTPTLLDAIVGGVVLECAGLGTWLVRTGAGRLVVPLCFHLASGAFLLLAVRASLASAGTDWIAVALAASLLAHLAALWRSKVALLSAPRSPGE